MTTYEIRPHGRTKNMFGYTLVTIEADGTERPLVVFPTERQAREAIAVLQEEEWKQFRNNRKSPR
jgi:hypothetical protein